MIIGGLQKLTLIDYPSRIAASVFAVGCNFSCPFCHNRHLVEAQEIKNNKLISEDVFFDFLVSRKDLLEGVCVSGGEPTLQPDLAEFVKKIKDLGFLVKLDTNGNRPEVLEKLLEQKTVDMVAMDIKNSLRLYPDIAGEGVNLEKIKSSVEIVKMFPDYEFRTTVLPRFHTIEELMDIADWLKGSKKYFLQKFRACETLNPDFEKEETYSTQELVEFCKILQPFFGFCSVRE